MLEGFVKKCILWEELTFEKFVKDCILGKGPHTGAEEEHKEEGVAETMFSELMATSIPHTPALLTGRR